MGGQPLTLRCPRCGGLLSTPAPPSTAPGWVVCPHCARPTPVIAPRDPAPLFTWEAFPQLYPSPAVPRVITPSFVRAAGLLLLVVTGLLLVTAGGYLAEGLGALPARSYTVGGHVLSNATASPDGAPAGGVPVSGAIVRVTGENGFREQTETGPDGGFEVTGVPAGGITVNVTEVGYAPAQIELFASAPYSAPASGPGNLSIDVVPGTPQEGTNVEEAPFTDLENFLSTVWSSTTVLGGAAILSAIGVPMVLLRGRIAFGVAGGCAGALSPLALYELGLIGIFPDYNLTAYGAALAGTAAAVLLSAVLASTGAPEPPD